MWGETDRHTATVGEVSRDYPCVCDHADNTFMVVISAAEVERRFEDVGGKHMCGYGLQLNQSQLNTQASNGGIPVGVVLRGSWLLDDRPLSTCMARL